MLGSYDYRSVCSWRLFVKPVDRVDKRLNHLKLCACLAAATPGTRQSPPRLHALGKLGETAKLAVQVDKLKASQATLLLSHSAAAHPCPRRWLPCNSPWQPPGAGPSEREKTMQPGQFVGRSAEGARYPCMNTAHQLFDIAFNTCHAMA